MIIAFVVVVWAAYFIPLALRRYDDASKTASVETSGALGRVISKPAPKAATASVPSPSAAEPVAATAAPSGAPSPARGLDRPAARLAARRRRRTLLTLIGLLALVGLLAVVGVVPQLVVAGPVVLIAAWLVACRVQVRGELGITRSAAPGAAAAVPAKIRSSLKIGKIATSAKVGKPAKSAKSASKVKAPTADEEQTIIVSGQFEDINPGRKHQMETVDLEADALDDQIVIAVPSVSSSGEALWDPLPVTLPTYVTKPRAGRTVRTIDFSQPNTWTSGHIEGEDVELPKRVDDAGDERRAVGH
nr:hypothetical protein [Aeromicrobium stalagmiti]